ncbi:MAG: NAD(P)/FAD-dependent oxidoreductase, partial [Bacteroidales bacterium]|nr:NAD(P)/FAD-dependent oxidoreductase [Bacteroidales bacterium]
MKNWRFRIADYVGYRRAVVTAGGINSAEIFSKTMQSRNVRGLFFAGEILDLDGDTGGYNLQIAFSTGALAGEMAARYSTGSETGTELFI